MSPFIGEYHILYHCEVWPDVNITKVKKTEVHLWKSTTSCTIARIGQMSTSHEILPFVEWEQCAVLVAPARLE